MKRHARTTALVACVALLGGCATVTVNTEDSIKRSDAPTWSDRKSFFLSGLIGNKHVDVTEVCGNRKVVQMQSEQTFGDGLLRFITFGIYAPRHAKVWCE
jgi:hypothetical protein